MTLLLAFVGAAGSLWLLTAGYGLLLAALARRGAAPGLPTRSDGRPSVAVVVPTRNEEACIEAKLRDLAGLDHAARVIVVDGGSRDATAARVEQAITAGARVELVRVPGASSKAGQLNHVLAGIHEEFVVVSDADTRLEPGCVEALVAHLLAHPDTAIVGAVVRPETRLLEERLHWQVVNRLWWLEGEAASATGLSGVCYAARRAALLEIQTDTTAEDVQLALSAGARGLRARLCPEAVATELRVPQTAAEFRTYRRRRGEGFANELRRALPAGTPGLVRLFRGVRRLQFAAAPALLTASVVLGMALLAAGEWSVVLLALAALAVPTALACRGVPGARIDTLAASALPWAACRLAVLLWLSLIAAPRRPPLPEKVRCSEPVI